LKEEVADVRLPAALTDEMLVGNYSIFLELFLA
jgi:hypothetical protein